MIIVGSRALGDYKPRSDWDLNSFSDEEGDDEYALKQSLLLECYVKKINNELL